MSKSMRMITKKWKATEAFNKPVQLIPKETKMTIAAFNYRFTDPKPKKDKEDRANNADKPLPPQKLGSPLPDTI